VNEETLYRRRKKNARIAGLWYGVLAMALFPEMLRNRLFVFGDIARTSSNVLSNESLFRASVLGDTVFLVAFLLLSLSLYNLLKDVRQTVAKLMVALVVVALPIALLNNANELTALSLFAKGEPTQAMAYIDAFSNGGLIAEVFWGLWLFPLGFLMFQSGFMPKTLGALVMIGCFGYLADSVAGIMSPSARGMMGPAVGISAIAEIATLLWLLIWGVKRPRDTAASPK